MKNLFEQLSEEERKHLTEVMDHVASTSDKPVMLSVNIPGMPRPINITMLPKSYVDNDNLYIPAELLM